MAALKEVLEKKIPIWRAEMKSLLEQHGKEKISEVTVEQAFNGLRGVKGIICDTSYVDPDKGLFVRGVPIYDLKDRLPEEIFFLLATGELPDAEGLKDLHNQLNDHPPVPPHVWAVLDALPRNSHPMTMLSAGILALQMESIFMKQFMEETVRKPDFWRPILEDSIRLLGFIPEIAAGIFRMRYNIGPRIAPDPNLDWAANYAKMLGVSKQESFVDLMRLYMTLHCDHEAGNVSAYTCHIVNSALSDVYLSLSAGLNGLAGPLHGLANQQALRIVMEVFECCAGSPCQCDLENYIWGRLKSGGLVPGYGHAVLRQTDPRFTALLEFGRKHCSNDGRFRVVEHLFEMVPDILKKHGKAKNPYPNVDAVSGSLLYHYGIHNFEYYTVPFAVGRSLGLSAQAILARALGEPITRPKSVTTDWVKAYLAGTVSGEDDEV